MTFEWIAPPVRLRLPRPGLCAPLTARCAVMVVVLGLATQSVARGQEVPDEPPPPESSQQDAPAREAPPLNGLAPARNNNQEGVERANGGLILNFQDANIDVVLEELSAAAGLIIVKEARPQGRVTLTSRQPVTPDEAVSLLNTVLHANGFAAIRQERILKIVELDRARHLNIPVRTGRDPEAIPITDELITQVIPLRHAEAVQLRDDLQPLVNPRADFAANAASNALVITDTSANVRRIVEIIAALDTTLADSVEVRVFQLRYASATAAAQLINSVFGNLEVGPGGGDEQDPRVVFMRQMQQQMRGRGGQQQQQASARGSRVNAAADERTNSIVVTGPGDTLAIVEAVIEELDENPAAEETVFVYRLRNAQALNVEGVVNSLFGGPTSARAQQPGVDAQRQLMQQQQMQRGQQGGGRGGVGQRTGQRSQPQTGRLGGMQPQQQGRGAAGAARLSPGAQQAAAALAGEVSIIADPDTNSLLVRTSPAYEEQVRAILKELDRPVPQVLIKVLIAEVTHDDSLDFGTEFSVLNLRAGGLGQRADTNFNIPVTGPNATGLVAQIIEQDFSVAIRALETTGKLDVLSRPYILASDNQLASITVGQEVPFITESRFTELGGIINTIRYDDIGILLDVIPHINPDGLVILDVAPEISTLTGITVPISEQVNAPVIAKRSAFSRVGVNNGQTIVIGGLMEDRKTTTVNKVPILGDIPLIRNAFRRTQNNKVKTELLIFLTPHIVYDPAALQEMAEDELDGTQLMPNAVSPGEFQRHLDGMQRGGEAAQRTLPEEDEPEARQVPPRRDDDQPEPRRQQQRRQEDPQ